MNRQGKGFGLRRHRSKKRKKLVLAVRDPMPLELKKRIARIGGVPHQSGGRRGDSAAEGVAKAVSPGVGKAALNREVNHLGHRSFRSLSRMVSSGFVRPICCQCGELLTRREGEGEHHLSKHAVSKLTEVDMSRKIIEKIFKAGWSSSSSTKIEEIDRILKVHNLETTLVQFEEHREMVKVKASRFPNKHHPRCLAEGNELSRFCGTTIACLLGHNNGSNGLCTCNVCNILGYDFGFSSNRNRDSRHLGVLTTSSSEYGFSHCEVNVKDGQRRL